MQSCRFVRFMLAFILLTSAFAAYAKEIAVVHKGITLGANLELAANKRIADGVILITHGTTSHRGMEFIVDLQDQLKEHGYSTLAITLSLGISNRQGMYDCKVTHRHHHTDAADEIGVWVNWLKSQGATRVALVGHSRGGVQAALYAAEQNNPLVKAVVLIAPEVSYNTPAPGYLKRYNEPLAPTLEKAQQLVNEGKGSAVLTHTHFLYCPDTSVTAETFVSYYKPSPHLDTLTLIQKSRKPTLVVVAGNDKIVIGLDKKVAPLIDGKRVQMKVIDDADHLFRDLFADEAADAIRAFLKDVSY